MKHRLILLFPLLFIGIFAYVTSESYNAEGEYFLSDFEKACKLPTVPLRYQQVRDTVYVLSDSYIVLSLKTQTAQLVLRSDSSMTFKISSGTSSIKKGMDTPAGIYTVQSKSPIAISKQFNNAELYSWVGFNGNIGFHALKGAKYYWSLGSKPSSHGCVRISREDGEHLYKNVKKGTPVFVFDETPARIITFAEKFDYSPIHDILLYDKNKFHQKIMKERLKNLYNGIAYIGNSGKVFLDGNTVFRSGGFKIGNAVKIPFVQELPVGIFKKAPVDGDIMQHKIKNLIVARSDSLIFNQNF